MLQNDRYRTGHPSMVRQMNLSAIMQYLHESGTVSRAALAEMTGLNKTTVSSLVRQLIAQGFVYEPGDSAPGTGRPAVLLKLNPAAGYIVAAEVGADSICVVRANFAAEVVWRHEEKVVANKGQEAVLDRLLALVREAGAPGPGAGQLLGLALGVPGLVDIATGKLLFAPNLGWRDVPLQALLCDSFNAPVFVDNEANMAALGEHYFGAAQGYDDVLYLSAGVGLGAGLLQQGRLVRGAGGLAGEVGHMTVAPEGELCTCGNRGCWETQLSHRALFQNVRRAINNGQRSSLPTTAGSSLAGLTAPMVVRAAQEGDPAAVAALAQMGEHLGIGIASLINALNPQLVVFGGPLSVAGSLLLPSALLEIERRALRWSREGVRVVLAKHGPDACIMGGVAAVLQSILARPGTGLLARAAEVRASLASAG